MPKPNTDVIIHYLIHHTLSKISMNQVRRSNNSMASFHASLCWDPPLPI